METREAVKAEDIFEVECFERRHRNGTRCGKHVCSRKHSMHLKWRDRIENLVVTVGLNHLMSRLSRSSSVGGAGAGYHDGRRLPTAWVASTAYSIGDIVRPTGGSAQNANNRFFVCAIAGTSAASEPTWPNSAGGTVTDNTVTWAEASVLYVGLVDGASSPTYAAGDTMASHGGWTENTGYSDATRQQFTPGAVASGSCDNSAAKAVFNINAAGTIAGCFLTDIRTKGGSAGLLYGEGSFAASRSVQSGDTLNVTVTTSVSG